MKHSNAILVESTGREISVLWRGVFIDVEEFHIISCDVDREKGVLVYDTNIEEALSAAQDGAKIIPLFSQKTHIGSQPTVTELELELMGERGVAVAISRRAMCYKKDIPCDQSKAPPGNCAGCKELRREFKRENRA